MSRRALRPSNVLRISRFLTVLVAAAAVVVSTIAPATLATASASQSTTVDLARTAGDPSQTGIVKAAPTGFNPGNIISDDVFFDNATMSAAQIQTFFNGKVSSCQAGYVCLKDARQSTPTQAADQYCSGYNGAANESAATIIYRVGQACGINPQVLIVMLQKEQGLVTHTWPSQWRYDMALGQGCPDTAPCDPAYAGFFYQIYGAARQMQIYAEGEWFTYYAPGNTWDILYHPNAACGRGPVYVENTATAALYYYTPYQPNAAAINAGYGEGDSCSSYGNRNFFNYFTDWFGPTHPAPPTPPPLQPINTSAHLVSVNTAGNLLAYPFDGGVWGVPQQLGAGFAGAEIFGAGDLNGDGNRDLVAYKPDGTLLFVSGTGSGYAAVWALTASWKSSVLRAAAGDFDGDGIPDMLTTNSAGELLLWRGDARGELRDGVQINSGWQSMNVIVGGTDVSGDGNTDIIARDSSGGLWLYPGDGTGGISGRVSLGYGWDAFTAITAGGDFDGDGITDVFARDASGGLWLYRGIGGGTVTNGPQIGTGWQTMTTISGPGTAVNIGRAFLPGAGDVSGDQTADVVVTTQDGRLGVYEGDGRGGWGAAAYVRSDWTDQRQLIPLGDFTGDGIRDLGSVDSNGRFLLWAGSGASGFADPKQIGSGWDPDALYVGGMDFDGDRRVDVLSRGANGALLMHRGNGTGGWATGAGEWIGGGWGMMNAIFYAGDFDGNGTGDLLARSAADGGLWLYSTDGHGSWTAPRLVGTGWSSLDSIFSPGDFDGDGAVDLLARTEDGTLLLYRGDGEAGWGAVSAIGTGWQIFSRIG